MVTAGGAGAVVGVGIARVVGYVGGAAQHMASLATIGTNPPIGCALAFANENL